MVRSFVLNTEQRDAINEYLDVRPNAMSSQVRQIRLRAKRLNVTTMRADIDLLERLAMLKIPKGRKSADIKASFTIGKSKYDPIIDSFLKGELDLVEVTGTNKSTPNLRTGLKLRIKLRNLRSKIKVSVRNDGVYLEKI